MDQSPANDEQQRARAGPESRQFDFWLGEWDLTWAEGGCGVNTIRSILDSRVIEERFDGGASIPLRGRSHSVYNVAAGVWQQTWVDNMGGYLDFTGAFEAGRMILSRDASQDGGRVRQRILWYNIQEDELDWNWERSEDGGVTWQTLWHIHYRRRAAGT